MQGRACQVGDRRLSGLETVVERQQGVLAENAPSNAGTKHLGPDGIPAFSSISSRTVEMRLPWGKPWQANLFVISCGTFSARHLTIVD